jgi:hypothetical protein
MTVLTNMAGKSKLEMGAGRGRDLIWNSESQEQGNDDRLAGERAGLPDGAGETNKK